MPQETLSVRALRTRQGEGVDVFSFFVRGADITRIADISPYLSPFTPAPVTALIARNGSANPPNPLTSTGPIQNWLETPS